MCHQLSISMYELAADVILQQPVKQRIVSAYRRALARVRCLTRKDKDKVLSFYGKKGECSSQVFRLQSVRSY